MQWEMQCWPPKIRKLSQEEIRVKTIEKRLDEIEKMYGYDAMFREKVRLILKGEYPHPVVVFW
jgi:hypothetical protein